MSPLFKQIEWKCMEITKTYMNICLGIYFISLFPFFIKYVFIHYVSIFLYPKALIKHKYE
jgi:hypothetical protein